MKRILLAQPKLRGFKSLSAKPAVVNLGDLDHAFPTNTIVTPQAIEAAGLVRSTRDGVKVLGAGAITKPLTFKGLAVSAPAKEKIETAGGRVE
jgi:large subunit ribosomal protein L15